MFSIPAFLGVDSSEMVQTKAVEPTPTKVVKDIEASVGFTGTMFRITNDNDFDWEMADITINGKYLYEAGKMAAGETYEIGAGAFTDKDSVRFNPFALKPTDISIYVAKPVSNTWYGGFR